MDKWVSHHWWAPVRWKYRNQRRNAELMEKSLRNVMAVMATSALFAVAGCATEGGDSSAGTGALSEYDLTGIEVSVGSKDFDEQLILGEMMVAAFEEAGATVTNKVDLGVTNIARAAL